MSIKVALADDHKIVREAIAYLLDKEPGIEVAGQADDGRAAVQLAKELQIRVIAGGFIQE